MNLKSKYDIDGLILQNLGEMDLQANDFQSFGGLTMTNLEKSKRTFSNSPFLMDSQEYKALLESSKAFNDQSNKNKDSTEEDSEYCEIVK